MSENFLEENIKLKELLTTFINDETEDNLEAFYNKLLNSELLIAFNPVVDDLSKVDAFANASEGEIIHPEDGFEAEYLILEADDDAVLPIFTNMDEAEEYEDYDLFGMHFSDILAIAKDLKVDGILVNPNDEAFFIDNEAFDMFTSEEG